MVLSGDQAEGTPSRLCAVNPGLLLTLVVLSGVTSGVLTALSVPNAAALTIACGALAALDGARAARGVLLCGCAFSAALCDGAWARDRQLASPLQAWFARVAPDDRAPGVVMVHGTLAADAAPGETGTRLQIDVESLHAQGAWRAVSGRLQAHVGGTFGGDLAPEWTAGRRIAVPVLLREPQRLRNPGSPGDLWVQLHRTIDLVGTIKSGALVKVTPARWWDEAAAELRRHVRTTAARYVAPRSAQSAAIVAAILIGDRAGLADDVQRRLRAAGTYHVIAISGGNVAILTSVCFVLLRVAIRSFRVVALITMTMVLTYGWVVGNEPSVRRAVTAACLYLAVSLIGLMPRALNVLALTAALVAVADPLTVVDAGAWLSFGATLGIIVGATRFMRWATRRPPTIARPDSAIHNSDTVVAAILRRFWVAMLGLFSATLAAEVTLLPVSAALFSRVSLLGLVLNFIAIPAMTVVQLAGLAAVACAGWWEGGAVWSGRIADAAASWLVGSSLAVDAAPWLVWRVPPSALVWTAMFYAGLAGIVWTRVWRWPRQAAAALAACGLVVIVTAPGLERAGPAGGRLRVTVLDVGQGDAILVQFPDQHALLVDAGGSSSAFDIGGRVVTPALWALGVRRLDWLAITHPDLDHIGGALAVERDLAPREIWEGVPVPPHPELMALRQDAKAHQIVWRQVLAGHTLELGSVVLDVLHPPAPAWERQRARNDDSVVIRLRFGAVEILLTGDAEQEFERAFVPEMPRFPLRMLKVGHHGSRSSSSLNFVETFHPQIAFVSAGRGNLFGHPAPDVLERYRGVGAMIFRTDQDGAIVIETDGRDADIRTMNGRRWSMKMAT
jgi:competence protein ComEC